MNLKSVVTFVLGNIFEPPLASAMATLGIVLAIAMVYEVAALPDRKGSLVANLKKQTAYLIFVILAHRLDELAVDRMFGWQGSTQQLVCLALAVREGLPVLRKIGQWAGVVPPDVLTSRLSQMEGSQVSAGYIDGRDLDLKIQNLKENMAKLKEYQQLKREAEGLAEAEAAPTVTDFDSSDSDSSESGPTI